MPNKDSRNYYVDWWNIRKSYVYGGLGIILFLAVVTFGSWLLFRENGFLAQKEAAEVPKDAARLISFEGEVRIIRATTRETILVTRQTFVSAGDTIQTQADGKAQVQMIDGSVLSVRPNSTVVIRDSASIFGGSNVRLALDGGQINVKTQDQTEATNNVVEVRQAENKLFPQTDASFGVNPAGGGEIRISRGGVETTIGGEKTIIGNGEFVAVNPNGKLSPKEKIIAPPKTLTPSPLEKFFASLNGTSDVNFRWQPSGANVNFSYRLEVSTSPLFLADAVVIEREPLTNPAYALASVSPGNFFWRVRATAASGQISEWSEASKFTIIKREENGSIEATDFQVEKIGGTIYIVSGKTQPGASVKIQGRESFAGSDGNFKIQISAYVPEATVELGDERGSRNRFVISLNNGKIIR